MVIVIGIYRVSWKTWLEMCIGILSLYITEINQGGIQRNGSIGEEKEERNFSFDRFFFFFFMW